jgi:hypothetical protein
MKNKNSDSQSKEIHIRDWLKILFTQPNYRILVLSMILFLHILPLQAQRLSRDYNVDILVNQAGYTPDASKTCVVPGLLEREFMVVNTVSGKIIYKGNFTPIKGDFGDYATGDFSEVKANGSYYILSDTVRSYPFRISKDVYEKPMASIIDYFSRQRCGNSATGYLTPCHLDDGVRMDNGKHQDVSGGWHDASDLRKWVGATIYGMLGIAKTYELYPQLGSHKLLAELRWGNRYFLNMQEPDGYIMSFVGGDVQKHSDSNRWTDNETGSFEEGEPYFTKPNAGKSNADMLIIGTKDDRVIKTTPLDLMGQYNFIASEAIVARIAKETDPDYSARCLDAAEKCLSWCKKSDKALNPGTIGASIQAALELYKTTGNVNHKEYAISQATLLQSFRETENALGISGFFYNSTDEKTPYKNIWGGCTEFYAICDLILEFPEHENVSRWKDMIAGYARDYLKVFITRNSFGIVPFGLYTDEDPGGDRKIGDFWYRYFMQPKLSWWVGINSNVASAGIGLLKASVILNDNELRAYAQKQLDWIIGVNSFNSSTLIGTGYNHPEHFPGSTFYPTTPVINGAVMNGLGGDSDDQPEIGGGWWQISEYWTPMVAHTLWLMAELTAAD